MKLIKKVEVNYFRSLYSLTLNSVGDLTVVFGRNDSGKSNLLRALNLFFNDETDVKRAFDFEIDMSDPRKQEAREGKTRQFVWVKITFNVPSNYRQALGEEISIKKQWNRDGASTTTSFPALHGTSKQGRLTRFLNEIDFTYIPAIKDLSVYADLIERMYGAASETEALQNATASFVDAIGGEAADLTKELSHIFNGPAKLSAPKEMELLFRNLDFSHGDEGHSLLRQKGDGIKARHLPEILRFINRNESRKKFHLWGFEEPENSLDLSAAEAEAARLAAFSETDDTQVFVTSHSPAFYLAQPSSEALISRFFVVKQAKKDGKSMVPKNAAAAINSLSVAEEKMENAGLLQLPYVIRRMSDLSSELNQAKEISAKLSKEIEQSERPSLIVEGKTDVRLFNSALERLGVSEIDVRSFGGGTSSKHDGLILRMVEEGGLKFTAPSLILLDNDKPGRSNLYKLAGKKASAEPIEINSNLKCWNLPFSDDFVAFQNKYSIQDDQAFFVAEFLPKASLGAEICDDLISNAMPETRLDWDNKLHQSYFDTLTQQSYSNLLKQEKGSIDWFFARGVPDSFKSEYQSALEHKADAFVYLDMLVSEIVNTLM